MMNGEWRMPNGEWRKLGHRAEGSSVLLLSIAAICAACAFVPACNQPSHAQARQSSQRRWNEARAGVKRQLARQQYERGLFEEAAATVSESINLDPTQVDAYVLLARAHLELSRPASAENAVQVALRLGLDSPDLHYTQGVILELRDRLEEAVECYNRARTLDPTKVDYLIAQVECLVEMDREKEAIELLERNFQRFDDDGAVAVLAGRIAALLGDAERAGRRYTQALETLREDPFVAEESGLLLVRAKRCDEAVALLRPLLDEPGSERPATGAVRRGLASCYLAVGDPILAQAALADYARSHPRDGAAQLLLAKAAVAADDLVTAARAVDMAEGCTPGHPEVAFVRAVIQWRRGDHPAAAATLEELLARHPYDVEAHCLLGEVLRSQLRVEESADAFYRAVQIDPFSVWAATGLQAMQAAEEAQAVGDAGGAHGGR